MKNRRHKKLIVVISALICIVSYCTACQSGNSEKTENPPKSIVNSITYVSYGSRYEPVSYVDGGEQQLSGEGSSYDWIKGVDERATDAPKADTLNQVDAQDVYSGSKPEHFVAFSRVASTGDWDFFPVKVRYEKYTLKNQPDCKEWTDSLGEKLTAFSPDTPLVFTEAFFFDWGQDGKEFVLVNVGNTIWNDHNNDENVAPNPPYSNNTTGYEMSALFADGNEPLLLYDINDKEYKDGPSKKPLDTNNEIYWSYLPPSNGAERYWCNPYSLVQRDANGRLIVCPVFCSGEFGNEVHTEMLLCDIDGDGQPELLTMQTRLYAPIIVYKLIGGKPQEVFRINIDTNP